MATIPTLPVATWVPDHQPTASELQTVLSAITFAMKPPGAVVKLAAVQSIPSGALTSVTFDTLEFDNDSMSSIPGTTLTVKTAGVFHLDATVYIDSSATGFRLLYILVNGVVVGGDSTNGIVGGGTGASLSVSLHRLMAVNDAITMQVFQNSGGALNLEGPGAGTFPARLSAIYRTSN